MPQLAPEAPVDPRCEELFRTRGGRVRALAVRLLGQDADDGVQEVAGDCGDRGEA